MFGLVWPPALHTALHCTLRCAAQLGLDYNFLSPSGLALLDAVPATVTATGGAPPCQLNLDGNEGSKRELLQLEGAA